MTIQREIYFNSKPTRSPKEIEKRLEELHGMLSKLEQSVFSDEAYKLEAAIHELEWVLRREPRLPEAS